MVAGHLQEKNGMYYVVLTYRTPAGKRKSKWQATGLPVKGNKKRAEAIMRELQDSFEPPADPNGPPCSNMLFADYLIQWLEIAKGTIKLTTYASYKSLSESTIIPYFRQQNITLGTLRAVDIQCFYQKQLERVKPNTVIHYHAIIHLRDFGLRPIRFHDLRHSCASLLLANGVPMKQIQEWLGHSDFSTTANIYSHLDYSSKISSAEAMMNGLGMNQHSGNEENSLQNQPALF